LKQFLVQTSLNHLLVETVSWLTVSGSIKFKSVSSLLSFQFKSVFDWNNFRFNPVQISFGFKQFPVQSSSNQFWVETVSDSIPFKSFTSWNSFRFNPAFGWSSFFINLVQISLYWKLFMVQSSSNQFSLETVSDSIQFII